MKISAFPVLTRRNVLMQRVLDNVTRGYWHHTSGTVAAPRALPMVEKFCDRYGIADGKDKRYRRRQLGGGNATLLLAPTDNLTTLKWFLMVTEGDHLAHREESLRDARAKPGRITIDGFERDTSISGWQHLGQHRRVRHALVRGHRVSARFW